MTGKTASATAPTYGAEKLTDKTDASSVLNVPVRNTSLTGAIFNLTKSAVGAGTVFLPGIFVKMGLGLGTSILLAGAFLCAVSLYFLGRMAHHCETGDYFRLGRLAMGKSGETSVSVSLLLFLMGGLIAYAFLTGQYLSMALVTLFPSSASWATQPNLTLCAAVLAIFPLSCMRDMSKLAMTSIFGMMCMLYISGLVAYDAIVQNSTTFQLTDKLPFVEPIPMVGYEYTKFVFASIGKIIFAFVNHFTIVSLVPVMKNPSARSRFTLLTAATVAAVVIYSLAVYGGYYRFGQGLNGDYDVLSVFNANTLETPMAYTVAQIALALVLVCSFPLLCDPARSCLDSLTFGTRSTVSPMARHFLETGLIVAVPTTVAFFVGGKAGDIMGLFSAICGSLLVFSFPGAFFVLLARPYKYSIKTVEKVMAIGCIVLGIAFAILGAAASLEVLLK